MPLPAPMQRANPYAMFFQNLQRIRDQQTAFEKNERDKKAAVLGERNKMQRLQEVLAGERETAARRRRCGNESGRGCPPGR